MSKEENLLGSGRADQSQPEIPSAPSGSQSVDPRHPASRLTIENVKKLEEGYTEAKSSLARQSIEAYLQWSNLFNFESEASLERRLETCLPSETELEAMLVGPPGEDAAENDAEPLGKTSHPDFQARSLTSSAPETKKQEFADLETQTEWSYPSTSQGSTEKAKRTRSHITLKEESESTESTDGLMGTLRAERKDGIEIRSIVDSSEDAGAEAVLELLMKDKEHHITESCTLGSCEFCNTALKRFPTPKELEEMPERMEAAFCCRTYKEIFKCMIEELMQTRPPGGGIDISPHPRLSQTLLNSKTRSYLMEELLGHGIENYKEIFEQYMRHNQWTKVGYKLSDHAPRRPTTVVKRRLRPKDILKIDPEFKPEHLKFCKSPSAVKKYYPDGKIFFLFLPDGTGQLLIRYPSGNIAILVTYSKDAQYTYLILADGPYKHLMAFFSNQGYVACYYPNGNIRVHLDHSHGSSFDERGVSEKCWSWWEATDHVHAPPLQPISIQFNIYIHVKIKAQDQIFLTFTKHHNCIRLNVGARLKLEDPSLLHFLNPKMQTPSVSEAKVLQIRTLLAELRKGLRRMSAAPPEQIMHLDVIAFSLSRLKCWQQKKLQESRKQSLPSSLGTATAPAQRGHN